MTENPKEECTPIFILGSARTGTSALVHALRNGAGVAGYNEGHLLTMMHGMIKAAVDYIVVQKGKNPVKEVMMPHVNVDVIIGDIMTMMKNRMESFFPGEKVWMDKTPDGPMIRLIPYLIVMWPKARFVFSKRRALENIVSRVRKFKHLDFKENCTRWAISMDLWNKMKHHIPENQRIEIDQYDMSVEPEATGKRLSDFLGFGNKEADGMAKLFRESRVEFTGGNEKNIKGLDELGWTPEQIDLYVHICRDLNRTSGYSEDSSYYLPR